MSDETGLGAAGSAAPQHGAGGGGDQSYRTSSNGESASEWAARIRRDLKLTVAGGYYEPSDADFDLQGEEDEWADDYFSESVTRVFDQLERLLLRKHEDYGPKNISDSPGGALTGLRVRIHDKVARINHLMDHSQDPRNESLEDSFIDLANYAVIAVLVLRKQWPE